jgi:EAL and modified HD-GYP domain-containing signal transduction protein
MTDASRARFSQSGGRVLRSAIARRSSSGAWPTYVARQPVYDRDLNVVAYELLFRDGGAATEAIVLDAGAATGEAALTAVADIGLDMLVGGRRALVNVSRSFLLGEQVLALPPDRVSLEVLESVDPDDRVMARLAELGERGYQVILDDFVLTRSTRRLLDVSRFVKLDVLDRDEEDLVRLVARLRAHPIRLIAEKIERAEQFEACRRLGFDYFQGFVFGVPQLMTGRRIRAGRPTVLTLLNALARLDVSFTALEAIIVQDVGLSLTLLRYMNSAAVGLHRRISSIRDAIVYLGTDTIRSFAYLVSLTAHSDAPSELARIGMSRAKMMQLVGAALGRHDTATCFTVGLLSVADALLGVPMDALLDELDELDEAVKRALAAREGELGAHLRLVEGYERGRLDEVEDGPVSPVLLRDAYLHAVEWADETAACLVAAEKRARRPDPLRRAS